MQILEKLLGNIYGNGTVDSQLLGYRLQCEDYSVKTFQSVYLYYSLNKEINLQNQTKS